MLLIFQAFEEKLNNGYPVVSNLNELEKKLLNADLETIRQYGVAFLSGPPEDAAAKKIDSKEDNEKEGGGNLFKGEKDQESSVDKLPAVTRLC